MVQKLIQCTNILHVSQLILEGSRLLSHEEVDVLRRFICKLYLLRCRQVLVLRPKTHEILIIRELKLLI